MRKEICHYPDCKHMNKDGCGRPECIRRRDLIDYYEPKKGTESEEEGEP